MGLATGSVGCWLAGGVAGGARDRQPLIRPGSGVASGAAVGATVRGTVTDAEPVNSGWSLSGVGLVGRAGKLDNP